MALSRRLRICINFILKISKWPTAIFLLYIYPALLECLTSADYSFFLFEGYWLWLGALAYITLWSCIARKKIWGSWFSTLEHEFTHALFAWITFHKVVSIRITYKKGGEMSFEGAGNWLITLAPYFFPTFSFLLIFLSLFLDFGTAFLQFFLGITFAYHIFSSYKECGLHQTDIKDAGIIFSICVIPPISIYCYLLVLGVANIGFPSLERINQIILEYLTATSS